MSEEEDREEDREAPPIRRDPATPRKVIPAVLFALAILVVVFVVFGVIEWARYHS